MHMKFHTRAVSGLHILMPEGVVKCMNSEAVLVVLCMEAVAVVVRCMEVVAVVN